MSRRARAILVFPLTLAVLAVGAGPALATDSTTTSSPTSTTSSTAPPTTASRPSTTAPHPPTTPAPPTSAPKKDAKAPPTSSSTSTTVPASLSPAAAAAAVAGLMRSGANNSTAALVDALRALETQGVSHDEIVRTGYGHFPIAGLATYRDDFGEFRKGPPVHTHQGNDVFAAFDLPVRAPFDGRVTFSDGGLAGKAATLTTGDGTYYFMAHLDSFAPGVASGSHVTQGQVVGLVGDSGNAKGGPPHVHFEIHPGGGAAVDPKATLDSWIAAALAAIQPTLANLVQRQPVVIQDVGLTRRFDVGPFDRRARPAVDPLLWASSVSPPGSALRLAEVQAARAADGIDWSERAADDRARQAAWEADDARAVEYLRPLTPAGLDLVIAGAPAD